MLTGRHLVGTSEPDESAIALAGPTTIPSLDYWMTTTRPVARRPPASSSIR